MNHDEYREKLSAFLDGELSDAERVDVLAHLEACETCQAYWAELTAMRDAFGNLEEIAVPDGFAEGVLARLHEEERSAWAAKAPKRRTWRSWAAVAACAAVVLLAGSMWRFTHLGNSAPMLASGGASPTDNGASGTAPAASPAESLMTTAPTSAAAADYDEAYVAEAAAEAAEPNVPAEPLTAGARSQNEPRQTAEVNEYVSNESAPADAADAGTEPLNAEPAEEEGLPVMTLMGEGAAEWLEENAEPLGEGKWRVTVEAVNALPDTLSLLAADLLREPVDGTLIITFGTTENPQ